MVWSASVERPCEAEPASATELLNLFGLELTVVEEGGHTKAYVADKQGGRAGEEGVFGVGPTDVSPSLIYATAAALEGCK